MKLFENYLNTFQDVLDQKPNQLFDISRRSRATDRLFPGNAAKIKIFSGESTEVSPRVGNLEVGSKALFDFDKTALEKYFGKNKASFSSVSIGSHPDFKGLSFDQFEYHHCVSLFVDMKGSSRLALNHSLEDVRLIKDSLLTICIHVANFFGGHVHRLQGDAAYIQFVRKGLHPNDSMINALNAATILCQFVSNDLARLFVQRQLNPIKIRIGIDYGSDEKVLWSYYGVPGCNELTTTSLHADLAAKLQQRAASNSIMIGDNIIKALDLPDEFYRKMIRKVEGVDKTEEYILTASSYRQYVFDWQKYLGGFDFIRKNADGTLEITEKPYTLKCIVSDGITEQPYFQNSYSLPKGTSIRYELLLNGQPYYKANTEEIIWEAHNRGAEAKATNVEHHDFNKFYLNQNYCDTSAAYLGHHFLKCTIKRVHGDNTVMKYPIYVQ
jgi:adenylate cyclase